MQKRFFSYQLYQLLIFHETYIMKDLREIKIQTWNPKTKSKKSSISAFLAEGTEKPLGNSGRPLKYLIADTAALT